jgi:hypothetical protein
MPHETALIANMEAVAARALGAPGATDASAGRAEVTT